MLVYIGGGGTTYNDSISTTIVHTNGTVESGFKLPRGYKYIYFCIKYPVNVKNKLFFSSGCAIEDLDRNSLMITGGCCGSGHSGLARVTMFDRAGNSVDLPLLNTGRTNHGCGKYLNDRNEQVYQMNNYFHWIGPCI